MSDVYRVPFNFSRTSLQEVKTLSERGHLVLFNENGRVGYIDPTTKEAKYFTQVASEVSIDNKYLTGNLSNTTNLQELAVVVDAINTTVTESVGTIKLAEWDSVSPRYFYKGEAVEGSEQGEAVWRVVRFDFTSGEFSYMNGVESFTNVWNSRESGIYT